MQLNLRGKSLDIAAVTRALLTEAAIHLNSRVVRSVGPIRSRIGVAVENAIVASPEFQSLVGGKLQGELGVTDPVSVIRSIIERIVASMQVSLTPFVAVGNFMAGGMTVKLLRVDLNDVLGAAGAQFQSEGGYQVDWLKWLLTAGDALIVVDYDFIAGPHAHSRTGLGVMRRGRGWRVPPEFTGTVGDNWLTRSLGKLDAEMELILAQEIRRQL